MPRLLAVKTMKDERGSLSVIEDELGFAIRRVFYIHDVKAPRGGHGHKRARIAMVAAHGEIRVRVQSPEGDSEFLLSTPESCLLLEPEDWHQMHFSPGAVLLVLASEKYDPDDYFYEPYRKGTP